MPTHLNLAVITALALLATLAVYHVTSSHSTQETEETAFKLGHVKHPHYLSWKKTHDLTFGASEDLHRAKIFAETHNYIQAHNANKSNTWTMKTGPFAHLSSEEFRALYLGTESSASSAERILTEQNYTESVQNLTEDIDWTTKGAVRRVKYQGQCASCWAFSVAGAVEGYAATTGKGQPEFSEQHLVDCSKDYDLAGCRGGNIPKAFNYVRDIGLVSEDQYPYKAVDQECQRTSGDFKIPGYVQIPSGDAKALAEHLKIRPIAVGVDASNFQHYSGGVFDNCGDIINHAVVLVGFNGNWKVKNSFGEGWGENGYVTIKGGNTCAIAKDASYPN